jgi:DNA-binding FadR family transcriptional regulator
LTGIGGGERELHEQFGISRAVIRKATRVLAQGGRMTILQFSYIFAQSFLKI